MDAWNYELQKEQERVNAVSVKIGREVNLVNDLSGLTETEINDIRQSFWEDVRVNLDTPDDIHETHTSIIQQAELLAERERRRGHNDKQLNILRRLKNSPYFGRIDFKEENETEPEKIYIGIGSYFDEETDMFLVYDWRAPISSVYYDYSLGSAAYNAPFGTIQGLLELKRQYVIKNSSIISMFDTGVTIGDELLQEVLGKQADSQMKSIVATIQKEQNRIIRNDKSRLLVVQGAAGSGKTSAALQRIAYLLYRYRDSLEAENILLFSPNPMFNSYVSNVLPELGEENMQQATFQQFLESHLSDEWVLEDFFQQMEYMLSKDEDHQYKDRLESIRLKSGLNFIQTLDLYIKQLGVKGLIFSDILFREKVLISYSEIEKVFYETPAKLKIPDRLKIVNEWLLKELKLLEKAEAKKEWVEEEIQYLEKEEYAAFYRKLNEKKRFAENTFDDFEREQRLLSAYVVRKSFRELYKEVKALTYLDVRGMYRQIFSGSEELTAFIFPYGLPQNWEGICGLTNSKLDNEQILYEDSCPFLYLKEELEGFRTNRMIRHVFIDEAQDYSPFQLAFIKRLFPRSRMTVLGDTNQMIYDHSKKTGLEVLASLYDPEKTESILLKRSYRSTRQISDFTRAFIPGGENIEPFNRNGSKPRVTMIKSKHELAAGAAKSIYDFRAKGYETIAVICKNEEESNEAFNAIRDIAEVRLVGRGSSTFESGVIVIPSYLAKGIEFDAVVIYNGSRGRYEKESERKLFYTACTRAMHELHVLCPGELNPFISEIPEELYEVFHV
ncbi:helicase [Bacillus sp. M6-12]|uniref:RNA polymerase recycling motor HelD n=1 Tax=Bacillus sp. M6-12 TaxID=2054166 RepID=UPI000C764B51|nr:RNA polymerase recycling motor HelD [Bacillus sp. M6-12]PLS16216.1 helicase [Bacillus sp. M6-12]